MVDPCGLAGGTPFGTWAPEWGNYVNTTYASHGDYGSKVLPEFPTNTVWKIGDKAEVKWLNLRKFFTWAQISQRRCQITILSMFSSDGYCPG